MRKVDNIIIGAGPGGYELAAGLAARGESTCIIERDSLGGTCLNRGCIPTKCLAASAEAYQNAVGAYRYGVVAKVDGIDYSAVSGRMNEVVADLRMGVAGLLGAAEVISGEAALITERGVVINGEEIYARRRLVIATGSKPMLPPVGGIELAMTSDDVLRMTVLPESAIIIGGGVIGLEFASILSSFGVDTSVIEYCKEILPPFDPDMAKRLRMILNRRGVTFKTGCKVESIAKTDVGVAVTYSGKKGPETAEASVAVCAVGRRPVVPEGLDAAGVETDSRGFIAVNEKMETSADGVYAIGDVNGLSMLAHSAVAQGKVVLGHEDAFDRRAIPSVVFTNPEIAMCGLSEAHLQAEGTGYRTVKRQFASLGKACAIGQTEGLAKFLVSANDGRILGATVLGPHASDLIAEATILIRDGRSLEDASTRYIHAHPTLSEIFA